MVGGQWYEGDGGGDDGGGDIFARAGCCLQQDLCAQEDVMEFLEGCWTLDGSMCVGSKLVELHARSSNVGTISISSIIVQYIHTCTHTHVTGM